MNLIKLKQDLTNDEGRRNRAYPDPLTKGAPYTIGIGHAGVMIGTAWDDAKIDSAYESDVNAAMTGLDRIAPWWRGIGEVRGNVLLNMCFNMGPQKLAKFKKFLGAASRQDWVTAGAEMLNSDWAHQVGKRAVRLALEMQTGVFGS